jgi:hypothetical protein
MSDPAQSPAPAPTPPDPDSPLVALVRNTIHQGRGLAELVRTARFRRRRPARVTVTTDETGL